MIEHELNEVEARVLGALLEKGMATPEYYPLSLVGLTNACNQKSNRAPVVNFSEEDVVRALDLLKGKRLVRQSNVSRVPKYEEIMVSGENLVRREAAVLCVLLLRGAQTTGEIRGRSSRLYEFADLAEVEETLTGLMDLAYVRKMARQPGRKEHRFMHLFCGEPESGDPAAAAPEAATTKVREETERLAELAAEVQRLSRELAELRQEFIDFKALFD